ncbi:hypothetical protein GCM10010272_69730 [Streptomyces lateritius]|nr:hypothetical protein GCM10010272_69730 [Streptomyces lateritius]
MSLHFALRTPLEGCFEALRRAHTAATGKFGVEATGPEAWGQGRVLGRRAGRWGLRLLSVPEDKRGGRLWCTEGRPSPVRMKPTTSPQIGSTSSRGPGPRMAGAPATVTVPPSGR